MYFYIQKNSFEYYYLFDLVMSIIRKLFLKLSHTNLFKKKTINTDLPNSN